MSLSDAANVAQIVSIVLAIPAACWAYLQLKAATVSAESQAILALDQALTQYEPLRKDLNRGPLKDVDEVLLRRYIAVFERLGLLLKNGVVSKRLADQLYGSRLEKLLTNGGDDVKKIIAQRQGRGWENFIYLWEQMGECHGLPDLDVRLQQHKFVSSRPPLLLGFVWLSIALEGV
jgi:hypothetical protein